MKSRKPAATGPSIESSVPKPASSAFADGSRSRASSRAGHVSSPGRLNVYKPAEMNAKTYRGQSSGSSRNALTAMSADKAARIVCVVIVSRRRSSASANAPPRIGKTSTGTSSTRPIRPTASVEPVIS